MTDEEFEKVVRQTLDDLPKEFKDQLDNVDIVIHNIPEEDKEDPNVLGTYHGVPKPERNETFRFPDKIIIYKDAILAMSYDETDAKKHISDTVLHELGHHLGLDDSEMPR